AKYGTNKFSCGWLSFLVFSFHPAGVFLRMKSRDIVSGGGVRGLLPELEFLRTEGSGGAGGMKVSGCC
ncbi:hypothetical protein, partial [Alistipes communis]|uniref:hypothetical protein n=2 Tax=Bacteroidales TaxID=171549 RepID=UPI003AEFA345